MLSTRSLRSSSPLPDAVSQDLQRIAACDNTRFLTFGYELDYSPLTHGKYSSVPFMTNSLGPKRSHTSSTSVSRSFNRHKRSLTAPLNEWAEARSPLPRIALQRFRSCSLRDGQHKRVGLRPSASETVNDQANIWSASAANKSSSGHATTLPTAGMYSRKSQPLDFAEPQRPPTSESSNSSSNFSFVEHSSSPEPAIGILARAECRRSADQEINKTEQETSKTAQAARIKFHIISSK